MSFLRLSHRSLPAVLLALLAVSPALGQQRPNRGREPARNTPEVLAAFRDVVADARKSVVRVLGDGKQVALGTVVEADGWIVTKASELKEKVVVRLSDDRELPAQVVNTNEAFDLAMLKVEAKGLTPVRWRTSSEAPVGFWVASVGPSETPVAVGVVSVAARKGPVRSAPSANSGYLGIGLDNADRGAKVIDLTRGSPADKAGLKVNDVVFSFNGKTIKDSEGLISLVQQHKPGDVVTLRIRRGDDEQDVKVTLGKRPAEPSGRGDMQNSMGSELSKRRDGFPVFLQHDTVLKPNECGGPLVDLDGRTIGVNISRTGRTDSYAIPAEAIQPLLRDLKTVAVVQKEAPAASTVTPERLAAARATLQRAEDEAAAAEKKVDEARAALRRAEDEAAQRTRKVAEARAALEKLEAEARKGAEKKDSK